eukprot:9490695-Pyramimonas_sp.AAC.1
MGALCINRRAGGRGGGIAPQASRLRSQARDILQQNRARPRLLGPDGLYDPLVRSASGVPETPALPQRAERLTRESSNQAIDLFCADLAGVPLINVTE